MISEVLGTGKENARTGRQLAEYFGCNIREITAQVRRERLNGAPICAASGRQEGEPCGYYLGNEEEIEKYCNRLLHRGREVFGARAALLKLLPAADKKKGKGAKHG